ncbi:MAG TPA: 50S ribosomal protein L6, partial [Methanomicrobiales archaeon]|nr:50S ribosomal protein L6 [Methanomicrobiales archaeon]
MATTRKVKIPESVTVRIEGNLVKVTGPKGMLMREMYYPKVSLSVAEREFTITTESGRKKILAICGTYAAHLQNMVRGVTEGYQYKMKVVYSHFPIQLKLAGDRVEVGNFLGEKRARFARIEKDVKVALGADEVTVTGIDKESVGKTAANIE